MSTASLGAIDGGACPLMRSNLLAIGFAACGAGCLALSALPGALIPAQAGCALGGALAASGLFLWKPNAKSPEP